MNHVPKHFRSDTLWTIRKFSVFLFRPFILFYLVLWCGISFSDSLFWITISWAVIKTTYVILSLPLQILLVDETAGIDTDNNRGV
jgi:hypothetical protein